ncbi:peptidase M16 [Tenacibaculum discolor]|uniref:Insulinase family protein n=1 Tax=Tenacibaculum discolor TaxID=361581 RepID=A0A2G1BVR6_9FLAO|nr:insulinase family protein [Tenacibaculum discolor]MDP2539983.1 insulinase family protein [Tenacibaculum discolor]PHN97949.1 peptidase M16 [Tenacibaculum discolor]PHO01572.1 peptidase M16 [Rhodobacteraceae bacterium 4F10]
MKTKIFSIITILFLSLTVSAQIDRTQQPKPGPAPKINLGTPKKFALPNGLQVLVVENHKLPRVSATLTIDNPPMSYGNKKGVEGLLSGMLGTGSTNTPKAKFDEEVDFLGANISFWDEGARASSLSKYFPKVLGLMADAAFNPVFTQEEFDKQMKQSLDGIKNNAKSVKAIASRVENALTYGKNHPFGEFTSEETLKNVTLQDVKDLYNKTYKPNNAYLIIIGDVNFNDIKSQVKDLFGTWKKGDLVTQKLPKVENPATTEINFIDMPNAVQSELSIINAVDLKMNDKDYYAALLANQILGGGGTGRLYKNLREDKGYTYGAYSGIGSSRYASRFKTTASVRNMVTDSAMVEAMKEINKIRYQKATQEELDIAKAKYIGNFVRNVEKPQTVASYALNILTNDLPADYYKNYLKNINAVTLNDVQNAAIKYFKGDKARIIITGKGIDVLKNLEKTADYKINYFDKNGNPTEKPAMSLPIPNGVTASSVVDDYFKAIGGKDKVANVKSVMITSNAAVQGMQLSLVQKNATPNKSSVIVSMMGNVMQKVIFDGTKGYQEANGQKKEMTGEELEKAKKESAPFADKAYKTGTLDRIEPIDGNNAYVIKHGKKEIFYDVKSGLKVKEVKTAKGPQGEIKVPVVFSDYKEVNGIKFPHKMIQKNGPMTFEFITKEIKINEGVSDADFK